jgi:dipeptidyl aminopeptidase/acylaminoacyl peptidase
MQAREGNAMNTTPIIKSMLLAVVAVAALVVPSAFASAAGSHGGAVVFSRVVTKTEKVVVKDAEGNPVKDEEGNEKTEEKTTVEGGLFAVKDGKLNQLTEDPTDTEPAFSPDGRAIAFVRDGDVFSVRADGSGLRRLTSGPELDSAPLVAPSGKFLVYERRTAEGAPADLYSVSMLGGGSKQLTNDGDEEHEASFSPDGKAVIYVRSVAETGGGTADDLYSMRPNGARQARLTRTARIDEFSPRYFAGGIVYSRGESTPGPSAYADVYTAKRNGKKVKAQIAGAGSAYVEDVTRDGHTVLFRRDQGLWVKRIGAGKARKISDLPDNSETNSVFSSDGKKVAAFSMVDGRTQLSSIDVASGDDRELAEGFEPENPSGNGGQVTTIGPVITWQPVR